MKVCKITQHRFHPLSEYCVRCGLKLNFCFINFEKCLVRRNLNVN